MSDIVERLRRVDAYQASLVCEAADCISVLRERLSTTPEEIEAAYARGYADATKSIAAVQVRSHG